MPASKRKRLRLARTVVTAPLGASGSTDQDAGKDDEERRLESLLFGKPFIPSGASSGDKNGKGKETLGSSKSGPSGLEHVLDEDLFFMDDGAALEGVPDAAFEDIAGGAVGDDEDEEPAVLSDDDDDDSNSDSDSSGSSSSSSSRPGSIIEPSIIQSSIARSSKGKSAWADPSDVHVKVSLASDTRLRKLRDAPEEDQVTGRQYENKLRRQYEKINPVPEWATAARDRLHTKRTKRPRSSSSSTSTSSADDVEEQIDELLHSTGGVLSSHRSSRLPQETLAIERLRDANQAGATDGPISNVRFHPSPAVPVLLTTGADRRLRLFNIDGLTNPLLQTLHIPDLVMSTALFHPTGSSIFLSGPRPFYYTYDLQSGRTLRSPRGLFQGVSSKSKNGSGNGTDCNLETVKFSPDGTTLAVGGRRGYVHILDWSGGGGAGQIIGSVKMNTGVKDVCWVGGGRKELMTLGQDAEVYLWDVGTRRCVAKWKDDGAFGPSCMEGANGGEYYAIGSSTGIVNVYNADAALPQSDPNQKPRPKPLKTLTNLTTGISSIRFDPSGQVMAISSKAKKDQLKMVHLPSLTTFANWPTSGTPLGTVTSVDFSAGSEYVAMGNTRGKVMLYHLRHFASGYGDGV